MKCSERKVQGDSCEQARNGIGKGTSDAVRHSLTRLQQELICLQVCLFKLLRYTDSIRKYL